MKNNYIEVHRSPDPAIHRLRNSRHHSLGWKFSELVFLDREWLISCFLTTLWKRRGNYSWTAGLIRRLRQYICSEWLGLPAHYSAIKASNRIVLLIWQECEDPNRKSEQRTKHPVSEKSICVRQHNANIKSSLVLDLKASIFSCKWANLELKKHRVHLEMTLTDWHRVKFWEKETCWISHSPIIII